MKASLIASGCLIATLLASAPALGQSGTALTIDVSGDIFSGRDPVKIQHVLSGSGTSQREHQAHYSFLARGSANLETGILRGKAMASAWDRAGFTTTFFDEFTVSGAPMTTAHVDFLFAVDGNGDLDDVGDTGREFQLEAQLTSRVLGANPNIGDFASYTHKWGLYTLNPFGNEIFETTPVGDVIVNQNEKSFFDVVLSNGLDVPIGPEGVSNPISVQWLMRGHASASEFYGGGFAILDVDNTGQAGLVLQDGYSYTSLSGVFLASPVPEPAALVLFPVGLLLLALGLRRSGTHP